MNKGAKELKTIVGQNIMEKRKLRGLTQDKLAELVGIGQQSLSRMEKGRIAPKLERLPVSAEALQCSVVDFFRTPDLEDDVLASSIADLIRPLSPQSRDAVLSIASEMVRLTNRPKSD